MTLHGFSSSATERAAIVNGDDFGLSPGINRGIVEAYRDGVLTSASLMAVGDAFEEAVAFTHEHPGLSLGIHLTLVEGCPVLPPGEIRSLVGPDGRFLPSLGTFLRRWMRGRIRVKEVQREFAAQIAKAKDHGIRIDKLDSHMHLHLLPGIFQAMLAVAIEYRIRAIRVPRERLLGRGNYPGLRGLWRPAILTSLATLRAGQVAARGLYYPVHFAGIAKSGQLTEKALLRLLRTLKPGVTEVMLHPGYGDSVVERWPMSRHYERERELRALTAPSIKALVRELQINLVSYRAVP